MPVQYIGEHILAGTLGNISIQLAFFFAVISSFLYLISSFQKTHKHLLTRIARYGFMAHFGFMLLAMGSLYSLIFNHAFEYQYVYQYSSRHLPFHFLVSCFWAGQEGSFLIWAFWQGFLALFLFKSSGNKEAPVQAVMAVAQAFLFAMLLGWKFGNFEIGNSPFVLMRNMQENAGVDFFQRADYAGLIADGNGLNPLLENIWMAIHPPILFLGYATVLIPFAYAFAGLVQKDYSGWLKPALPWAALAAFNLGTGIILGGAWAYIDLTFGGFWAWDPVENASLVPWLTTVATLHLMLLARHYRHNLKWAFFLAGLSYTLVVYASYLTRSGVLKDASAHAFGEEGKAVLLVIFTLFFLGMTLGGLYFFRPEKAERVKEQLNSREFWMFVGSIILILSAFQIIITTSIPVINKVTGSNLAPPNNSVAYYNKWQLPYGILIILLVGMAHYLKYGKTDMQAYLKRIILPGLLAFAAIVVAMWLSPFDNPLHYVFLFFIVYALYTAIEQLFSKNRTIRNTGGIVAHLGLAVFMFGILLAFSRDSVLTRANHPQMTGEGMSANQILMKGEPSKIGPYTVIYSGHRNEDRYYHFTLDFYRENNPDIAFSLEPVINKSSRMGDVFEPRIKHLFDRDIYTVVSYGEAAQPNHIEGYSKVSEQELMPGQSMAAGKFSLVFDSIHSDMKNQSPDSIAVTARMRLVKEGDEKHLAPVYIIKNREFTHIDARLPDENLVVRFERVSEKMNQIVVGVYQPGKEYIVLKVMVFPWIILLWLGAGIMFTGFFISMLNRARKAALPDALPLPEQQDNKEIPESDTMA